MNELDIIEKEKELQREMSGLATEREAYAAWRAWWKTTMS